MAYIGITLYFKWSQLSHHCHIYRNKYDSMESIGQVRKRTCHRKIVYGSGQLTVTVRVISPEWSAVRGEVGTMKQKTERIVLYCKTVWDSRLLNCTSFQLSIAVCCDLWARSQRREACSCSHTSQLLEWYSGLYTEFGMDMVSIPDDHLVIIWNEIQILEWTPW